MSGRELARFEQASPIRTRLLLTGFIFALYVGFATRTFYWDGVLFSLYIEKFSAGEFSKGVLFHPNHLFYNAVGYLLYRGATALGFHGRAISVLQGLNIAASIVTASLVFAFAQRITQSRKIALFCLALFAFGATWWKFSTDANSYIVSVLFSTLAINLLLKEPPRILSSAICYVIAMMFHQLAVFLCVPAVCAIAWFNEWPRIKRIWTSAAYLAGSAAAILMAYWLAYSQVDHASAPTLVSWILTRSMDWRAGHSLPGLVATYFASYVKLFLGGRWTLLQNYLSLPVYLGFALCLITLATAAVLFRRPKPQSATIAGKRTRIVLWAWIIVYAIFLAWWEPGAAFHKLYLWPPVVLLIGVWIARKSGRLERVNAFLALTAAVAAWNFSAYVFPHAHSSADPVLMFAQTLDRQLPPRTTVYYSNLDSDDWYLEYFAPGRKWSPLPPHPDGGWMRRTVSTSPVPVCFETSALDRLNSAGLLSKGADWGLGAVQRWSLVNKQHRIRFECLSP
ncbi:MAG TPA: hypothetical protein VH477_10940 [Bryobacteraceae bacterium]